MPNGEPFQVSPRQPRSLLPQRPERPPRAGRARADTLAQAVRLKYPGAYDHIPDHTLEELVIRRYPGKYDHLPRTASTGQDTQSRNMLRPDGTRKGEGYFGVLQRPDGRVSTELSINESENPLLFNEDGSRILYPALVPGLTQEELEWALAQPNRPGRVPIRP